MAIILDYFLWLTAGFSMMVCPLNIKKQLFHNQKILSQLWKSAPTLCELHQNDPKMVSKHHQYINMNLQGDDGPKNSCPA